MGERDCPYMPLEDVLDKFPTEKCSGCPRFKYEDGVGECEVYSLAVTVKTVKGE